MEVDFHGYVIQIMTFTAASIFEAIHIMVFIESLYHWIIRVELNVECDKQVIQDGEND